MSRRRGRSCDGEKPYLVGEAGPKIFVPSATGRIETNGVLNSLSLAGGRATGDKGLTVGVDATAIEQAGETAKKGGAIITASLDTTTKPIVDTSSIEAATAAAEKLKAVLATVGGSSISVGGEGGGGAGHGGASGGSSARSVGGAASKAGAGPADASGGRSFGARADLTAGAKESYDFWREKGLSHAAAAGFAGSEQGENNFKAHGYGDKGHAYGSMTRARVYVPCTKALKTVLDCLRALAEGEDGADVADLHILDSARRSPWNANVFPLAWVHAFQTSGITDDLHFHDIRGTAVTRLAEAGCTVPEIATITGHTLASVTGILERYLSRTRTLAESAIAKLELRMAG